MELDYCLFIVYVIFLTSRSFFVFHLASFHHKISMKLRSDVNSLQSLSAGMH